VSHEPGPLLGRADRVLTVAGGRLVSDAPGNGTVTPTTVHAQCG